MHIRDILLLFTYICYIDPLLGHPQVTEQLEHRRCLLTLNHDFVQTARNRRDCIHFVRNRLKLDLKRQYVPEVEDAQRIRSASARASRERRYCSNPVINVHALCPCLVLVATVIGRSAPFLVKGSSLPIAMRYQGCIRPHKALSASSRFANSGTGTAPFAFGEPYSTAEKTASALTLRYCCSTRLTSSCFATYARSADLTSAWVYRALVLS